LILSPCPIDVAKHACDYSETPIAPRWLKPFVATLFAFCLTLGVAIWSLRSLPSSTKQARAEADLQTLATQVVLFKTLSGRLPTNDEGLTPLVYNPGQLTKWRQLLLKVPIDPWGNPYQLIHRSVVVWKDDIPQTKPSFGLYSCGPDGISNSAGNDPDDIRSW
jgi:type II secretion system protein G